MTTSTGRDCEDSNPGGSDLYENQNSAMSGSQQPPPSGPVLPGGPNGPDGTVIEEVMTAVVGKKQPVRGQAYRAQNGEYVSYFCTDEEVLYRPGDSVYIESQKADQPYFICSIQEFRRSKRDNLMVNIKWFYRPSEVPETVYQLLVQDRNTENNNKSSAIDQPEVKSRELFISDATDTYPVSVLRGICRVEHYADIHAVREFQPELGSFFYILGYNPETRRLASAQGEIRIGPSHQAKLPEFRGDLTTMDRPEQCEDWEEIRWQPGVTNDETLLMYLRSARSIAAFAGLCDNGGSMPPGTNPACKDATTIGALDALHETQYDHGKALEALTKCPIPEDLANKWSDEDIKRFIKGLRLYGKNFFRIRKEYLAHKDTRQLVSFYYLWKKTPAAAGHRPHRRHRRQNILRRIRNPRGAGRNAGPADPLDPSSASEKEDESDDSDSKDRQGYHCRHCYTTASRDWHHAGKEKQLLCYDCRMHFKHYGDLPVITNPREPPPPSVVSRSLQPAVEEEVGMRTRTRAKEICTRQRISVRSRGSTPDINDDSDSHTPDRNTPDLRASRNNSPSIKKVEDKIQKLKRMRLPEDEGLMELASKKKKEVSLEPSIASSDDSMDSLGDDSSKSSEEYKPNAYSEPLASLDNESTVSSGEVQSCSVILKASQVSNDGPLIVLSKMSNDTVHSGKSSPTLAIDRSSRLHNGSSESELAAKSCDGADKPGELSNSTVDSDNKPSHETNSASDKADTNTTEVTAGTLPKMPVNKDDASPNSPIPLTVASNSEAISEIQSPISGTVPTLSVQKDNDPCDNLLLTSSDSHASIPLAVPIPTTTQESPIPFAVPLPTTTQGSQLHTHSTFTTSSLTTSVIHSSHVVEPCPISKATSPRSGTPPHVQQTSRPVGSTLSVASMLSQPPRISVLAPNDLRNRSNSPTYAPPPAHSSVPQPLPRAFPTASPPPAAHPSSPQFFRSHLAAPLSHSALSLANSPLNVSSMISSFDEAKPRRVLSPKDPLPLYADRPSSPLSDQSPTITKPSFHGQDSHSYLSGFNSPQRGMPVSSGSHTHLHHRSDKSNVHPASLGSHVYSVKSESDQIRHTGTGMHFPYGKQPFHDLPLSLSTSGVDSLKSHRIPSPIPAFGQRVIRSPTPSSSVKHELIKKEFDYSRDRFKQESSGELYRPEYKPDIIKKERFDVKQERYDRPEIIAEIKAECKSDIPASLAVPGLISQVPGHYPYPYTYMHHQGQFMSPKFSRTTTSPTNLSTLPKSASPPLQVRGPAPPAHIGSPGFHGRSNLPGVKPPGLLSSPGTPIKSPGSSSSLVRESQGLISLPTPPAAHTGPVKPPMASHPLHSPLSCIIPNQQSLALHQHSLPPSPSPNSQSSQPPTTQALPPTVPPHSGFNTGSVHSVHVLEDREDDDEPSPHREPSPAPKIEDSEFHRSQSAVFLRHWNRGDFHSCARTDLTFKPVPESKLCRKREERARRHAEREREEKERAQKKAMTPEKREIPLTKREPCSLPETPNYSSPSSMYERLLPRAPEVAISTMSRLGVLPSAALRPSIGLPPSLGGAGPSSHLDPLLQHYSVPALYPMGSRERMEYERERDMDRLKEEMLKQRSHLEAPPPYGVGLSPHILAGPRYGPPLQSPGHGSAFPPPGLYAHQPVSTNQLFAAERDRYERIAAASLASFHAARPSIMRPPDTHPRLAHGYPTAAHAALLGRPYEEQLAHLAAQEQMQRQLILERDRLSHLSSQGHFRP